VEAATIEQEPAPPPPAPPAPNGRVRTAGILIVTSVAACFALYFGRAFFVPIVFAILFNALLRPLVRGLEKMRLPTPAGAAIVTLGLLLAVTVLGFALAGPVNRWIKDAPQQLGTAESKLKRLLKPMQQVSDVVKQVEQATKTPSSGPAPAPVPEPAGLAANLLGNTWAFFTGAVEVIVLLYLLLAAGDLFVTKLLKVIPYWPDKKAAAQVVHESQSVVMRYMVVNAFINAGQGVVVGLVLWWLGIPSPVLWAFLTFVLEFVPYLGAAIMITMLSVVAFAPFEDVSRILMVPGSYLLITTLQNNIISPYAYGQHLKLNPVAVLIGVLFWWFLWGIPGAFLAVPIIAACKIAAEQTQTLKPVGEFLGD
jgi:predicted PurR-regulated permease PerM